MPPLRGYNRVVPPQGPPKCRALLRRRGVTRAQAPRDPVNVREPAPDEFRFPMATEQSRSAIGGRRRTPLRPGQPYASLVPETPRLRMRDLEKADRQKCIRSVTDCHRTDTNRLRGTGSPAPPWDYLAILSPLPCGQLRPLLRGRGRSRRRGQDHGYRSRRT